MIEEQERKDHSLSTGTESFPNSIFPPKQFEAEHKENGFPILTLIWLFELRNKKYTCNYISRIEQEMHGNWNLDCKDKREILANSIKKLIDNNLLLYSEKQIIV